MSETSTTTSTEYQEIKLTWKEKWQMLDTKKKVAVVAAGVCGIAAAGAGIGFALYSSGKLDPKTIGEVAEAVSEEVATNI